VPQQPTSKPRTGKTGQTQAQEPAPATTRSRSTQVNPDSPIPGTRDIRITKGARQDFRGRKIEIKQSYKGEARLPREAQQLTATQRTSMRHDVREHQVATKQFKEAFTKVQKWNKRDPGTLTTTEHRSMVRDQQMLDLAQKQVQKTETKLNGWYKKIGKKPIDTVVSVPGAQTTKPAQGTTPTKPTSGTKPAKPNAPSTPTPGPRPITVTPATQKAFQAEWQRFTAENGPVQPSVGKLSTQLTKQLNPQQRKSLISDLQKQQLSQSHVQWKQADVDALQKIKPSKMTPVQKRQLNRNQQLLTLSEQNLKKIDAKVATWETKLGRRLTVKDVKGQPEIGLGAKVGTTTKPTGSTKPTGTTTAKPTPRTSAKGTVKPGARTQATNGAAPTTGLKPLNGKVLPGLLAINDAYSLYQGVSHWNDEGNTKHFDDALRVGGSAMSTYASVQAFRKGDFKNGIGLHATGLAMNLLGQMTNDQD
jgi:hypothetical protein